MRVLRLCPEPVFRGSDLGSEPVVVISWRKIIGSIVTF